MTSTQCKPTLPHTTTRTIIDASGEDSDKGKYTIMYAVILESHVRAYHDWEMTSQTTMLVFKVDSHPKDSQEQDLPLCMARPFSDPALTQAVNQINVPHQYDESMEDFSRRRAVSKFSVLRRGLCRLWPAKIYSRGVCRNRVSATDKT